MRGATPFAFAAAQCSLIAHSIAPTINTRSIIPHAHVLTKD